MPKLIRRAAGPRRRVTVTIEDPSAALERDWCGQHTVISYVKASLLSLWAPFRWWRRPTSMSSAHVGPLGRVCETVQAIVSLIRVPRP